MPHAWKQTIVINDEIATELIKQQQHLPVDSIKLLDEGWDNVVYRVNEDLIFRFPRREFGVFCMENEIALLPFIARHVSFVLTRPEWIGRPSDLYPYAYAGYRMIPGLPLCEASNELIDNDRFAIILATWLKELHALKVSQEHIAVIKGEYEWKLNVAHRIQSSNNNLLRYEHYFIQAGFRKEDLLDTIHQLSRLQFKSVKQSFVHGDLYSRHIIVDPVSLLPTGLIDWGDIHIGHPAIDLASGMVLTERAFNIFLDAYGSIDEESRAIMGFHAFCHGMSFLPYAFEQDKDDLKRWAMLVLARAMQDISNLQKASLLNRSKNESE